MNEKIPARWSIYPLKDICYFQEGPGLRNWQYKKTGIKFLNIRCIKDGKVDLSVAQSVAKEEVNNKYKHFLLDPNDYVLSSSGTLGRLAKIDASNLPLLLNTSIIRFRSSNENVLDHLFLRYFLQSKYFFDKISEQSQGSAQANVGPTHLKLLNVALPTLPEQKKIASILNSVDEVIEKTQLQINKLQDLKKGTINELLTKGIGHTEFKDSDLGRIPKSWEIKKLEELVNHQRPITYGIVQTGENIIEGIPCVRVVDIVKNRPNPEHMIKTSQKISDSYKRTILQKNDILFALRGEIGHVVKTSNKIVGCNLTRGIALLSSSENIGSDFLIWALRSDKVRNEILDSVNGSALQEIPLGNLRKVTIPVPTTFEQNKIANILESINSNIESTNIKLSQTQSLKKSLMQDLLTGKVRVQVN